MRLTLCKLAACMALLASPLAHALESCEINGESVNPANGHTTAGKTGTMRCQDRDSGVLTREQGIRDGKFTGLVRRYQNGKLQREYTDNAPGNRHGQLREFSPTGQVLREENYDNGRQTGQSRSYYPDGQLMAVRWQDTQNTLHASAEFNERGQLQQLRCAEQAVLAPAADDAAWCGFAGKASQIELFGSRGALTARSSYLAGKRVRHEIVNNEGKTTYLDEVSASARTERYFSGSGVRKREVQWALDGKSALREREQEFADSGTLSRDRRWTDGRLASDQSYYLNGQPRSKREYSSQSSPGTTDKTAGMQWLQGTEYFDSGKVSSTGRYSVSARGMQLPVGVHELFDESGGLLAQSTYDERGRISREKVWDAQGQLLRDDAVFEDGSRKAFAK